MADALMLIDVQRNMLEGEEPIPTADRVRDAIGALLDRARAHNAIIVVVQNDGGVGDPDEPGTPGWEFVFAPREDDIVVHKNVPNTFASNPDLAGKLTDRGVERVVLAGMQSDYCIIATASAALGHGFAVELASGAHGTYDDDRPAAEISADIERELAGAGATITDSAAITFAGAVA